MDITTFTGIAASVFTSAALLPQLFKLFREKQARGISLMMLVVLFTGLLLWTIYGILKRDLIIVVANSFSLVVNLLTATLAIRYKFYQRRKNQS